MNDWLVWELLILNVSNFTEISLAKALETAMHAHLEVMSIYIRLVAVPKD